MAGIDSIYRIKRAGLYIVSLSQIKQKINIKKEWPTIVANHDVVIIVRVPSAILCIQHRHAAGITYLKNMPQLSHFEDCLDAKKKRVHEFKKYQGSPIP